MGTDYDRMIRQQKLAESLLRQIWNDPSSASEFLGALLPKVRTNLSLPTAMEFASELESSREISSPPTRSPPTTQTPVAAPQTISAQWPRN